MHNGAGFGVYPDSSVVATGSTILLLAKAGPMRIVIPCRFIYVIDEPRRYGFAYGTLPGHPECGEEAFVVEHRPDDEVVFAISASSRPADWLVRIGGPFVRRLQARATSSYLKAVVRLAADA
jgi:uncharacterized protein (UPF0548 family)